MFSDVSCVYFSFRSHCTHKNAERTSFPFWSTDRCRSATFYGILVYMLVRFYMQNLLSFRPVHRFNKTEFRSSDHSTVLLNIFGLLFGCWCYVHVIIMLHYFIFFLSLFLSHALSLSLYLFVIENAHTFP